MVEKGERGWKVVRRKGEIMREEGVEDDVE